MRAKKSLKFDDWTCGRAVSKAGMDIHKVSQKVQVYKNAVELVNLGKNVKRNRKLAEQLHSELELLTA